MSMDRACELQERAWTLQADGKLEDALAACLEALQLTEQCEGSDSPDVTNLLNDLAEIERDRQNFQAAQVYAERALAIEKAHPYRFNGETAATVRLKTLALVGELRRIQGDYAHSEVDLQEAVNLSVQEFGEASQEYAQALNDLGVLYKHCGRFDEALRLYTEALRLNIAAEGEECLAAITIYHNMGGILFSKGDFATARPYGEKAWELSRRLLGETDPRTMADAAAYAAILDGLGRYNESESIYRHALGAFEKSFGPVHYEVAATLHNLGAVLVAQGKHKEAEEKYRKALAMKEELLGARSTDTALTRCNLGSLLNTLGRRVESVPLLTAAIAVLEEQLTAEHPQLLLARENLRKALS